MQAEHIDAEVVRRHPLPVKRINTADSAEKMPGSMGVELIFRQKIFARKQFELTFVHLDHECIFSATDRAIAGRQFGKIGLDFEPHRTAVATAFVILKWTMRHQAQPAGLYTRSVEAGYFSITLPKRLGRFENAPPQLGH